MSKTYRFESNRDKSYGAEQKRREKRQRARHERHCFDILKEIRNEKAVRSAFARKWHENYDTFMSDVRDGHPYEFEYHESRINKILQRDDIVDCVVTYPETNSGRPVETWFFLLEGDCMSHVINSDIYPCDVDFFAMQAKFISTMMERHPEIKERVLNYEFRHQCQAHLYWSRSGKLDVSHFHSTAPGHSIWVGDYLLTQAIEEHIAPGCDVILRGVKGLSLNYVLNNIVEIVDRSYDIQRSRIQKKESFAKKWEEALYDENEKLETLIQEWKDFSGACETGTRSWVAKHPRLMKRILFSIETGTRLNRFELGWDGWSMKIKNFIDQKIDTNETVSSYKDYITGKILGPVNTPIPSPSNDEIEVLSEMFPKEEEKIKITFEQALEELLHI